MSKDNFEGIISELLKGQANIESVNFHFGDCNSTTYMGGEVEEEYEEEYGCGDCGCGCCHEDLPVVDNDAVADWVEKKTGIDRATIEKVLEAETEYLEEIGVAFPVDHGEGPDEGDNPEQESKPVSEGKPEQKDGADADSKEDALDGMLDKMMDDIVPGLLCMGLMGAIFDDILNPGKAGRKEKKDGKNE
ncbi:MAG: hypothetical protein LIP11_16050 [Clostridiales bacterium]|nr:hypothetical protein [Clostridiales bacterium]